jgi:hypothetical protein
MAATLTLAMRSVLNPVSKNPSISDSRSAPNLSATGSRWFRVAIKSSNPAISQAVARLRSAVGALEAAAERRLELDRGKAGAETELALMQDDRSRLATELDLAMARAERLSAVNKDVDRRIDSVMAEIRDVLDGSERA